jgi:hypothetical protein
MSKYTVREVYLVEKDGYPVDWYYDRSDAEYFAKDDEEDDED